MRRQVQDETEFEMAAESGQRSAAEAPENRDDRAGRRRGGYRPVRRRGVARNSDPERSGRQVAGQPHRWPAEVSGRHGGCDREQRRARLDAGHVGRLPGRGLPETRGHLLRGLPQVVRNDVRAVSSQGQVSQVPDCVVETFNDLALVATAFPLLRILSFFSESSFLHFVFSCIVFFVAPFFEHHFSRRMSFFIPTYVSNWRISFNLILFFNTA